MVRTIRSTRWALGLLALAALGCQSPQGTPEGGGAGLLTQADARCSNECTVGAGRCAGPGESQTCALQAGCGIWGAAQPCVHGCDGNGGRCRTQAATCGVDGECSAGETCLRDAGGLSFGEGRCAVDCSRQDRCTDGTRCVDLEPGRSACLPTCATPGAGQGACGDGWVCEPDGAGGGFCLPRCTEAACTALGMACDAKTGHCTGCGQKGETCCAPETPGSAPTCDTGRCIEGRCQ